VFGSSSTGVQAEPNFMRHTPAESIELSNCAGVLAQIPVICDGPTARTLSSDTPSQIKVEAGERGKSPALLNFLYHEAA